MSANIIIFKDEGGVGVQVGEERQYIGDDLMGSLHSDYHAMDARIRALDAENISLRENLTRQKEESLYKSMRYDVIATIIG